ncbi:nicotinate-nucleotide adenylyltransferase [Acetobacter sp. AN02]|uniref:nicotinate-nucleotide adenylyltransferase n=1 Tax=Acetobacter sp. AN02 TaxID=2894186 RepID=UPI0024346802|nr:nicotinate-nucleotide adenylyltransferase [Acetobacter sp. AN02]MDG6094333.1 nicotinate-nucleotide adenylyltransferase [Acetobacter sp. AN02]
MLRDAIPRSGDRRRTGIGLLGGSFNPAHQGHLAIALRGLHALRLDEVWFLVSPGNPLKTGQDMALQDRRRDSVSALSSDVRLRASTIESQLGTRYAIDTVRRLRRLFPRARFVWLMGADVFAELPRWRRWRQFLREIAVAVIPRPGSSTAALHGQTQSVMRRFRLPPSRARRLSYLPPPVWAFLPGRQNDISATELRRRQNPSGRFRTQENQP